MIKKDWYNIKRHSDGQITAVIDKVKLDNVVKEGVQFILTERVNSYEDLFKIASLKEVLDHMGYGPISLNIPCLFGQRGDRRFNLNESFDLKIIANFINSLNFKRVYLLHPHSSVSSALINNSISIDFSDIVLKAIDDIGRDNLVLISPDAGAYKWVYELSETFNLGLIPSNKIRENGEPKININGDVKDKVCLILDDLLDYGRTFTFLAKSLKSKGALKVYVYITHGMFNGGTESLMKYIDGFYTTNSYADHNDINIKLINHENNRTIQHRNFNS